MIFFPSRKIRKPPSSAAPGGRRNRAGRPAVCLAENISLAILETIVHCQCIGDLHNRVILSIEVFGTSVKTLDRSAFPGDWSSIPRHAFAVETGTAWLESRETLLLKVPSSTVVKENIYILNPGRGRFKNLKIVNKEIFTPDNRPAISPFPVSGKVEAHDGVGLEP
ncbi:MAG TPA: RES domain-containing protein [Spirochaetota bacterium]|nr:RES domain-containing protein [Spirochaetota bacterium]